jgi:hypothetical protein
MDVYDYFYPSGLTPGRYTITKGDKELGQVIIEEENLMNPEVWVTRIVIGVVAGGEPFEIIVRNDCLTYEYVRNIIAQRYQSDSTLKNIFTIWNTWRCNEQFEGGYYPVEVAGTQIGAITLSREKMPCVYGARVINQPIKYKATLNLVSSPFTWENTIHVKCGDDPSTVMREVVRCSPMRGLCDTTAMWLNMAAKHIPDNLTCGDINYAGVKIGSYKIEEICDG